MGAKDVGTMDDFVMGTDSVLVSLLEFADDTILSH